VPSTYLCRAIEKQAAIRPEAIAVWCGDDSLTYYELNRRANRLARYLRSLGSSPEAPVGVLLDRGLEQIVSLLAILKSGAPYLPLDPAQPYERVANMVDDAAANLVITQGSLAERLPPGRAKTLTFSSVAARIARESDTNPDYPGFDSQLAYVIYTSGSTGKPKGIAVTHASVQHLFSATGPILQLNEDDRWTVVHSTSFDFSVWEIWGALVHGAQLVVVPASVTQSPISFAELLRKRKVSILSQTPSALRQLLLDVPSVPTVRAIVCGGEGLPHDAVEKVLSLGVEAWNFYGPTEATVWASCKRIEAADARYPFAPIGRVLPGNTLLVLDEEMRPMAPGEPGELYIGGPNLALSYYRRPELTGQQFLPNPFGQPGSRLYKTGDLARTLPDGDLEFLGRVDHQVKIRGYRIELGEIEACLRRHPGVDEAVVVATDGQDWSDRGLAAYVVPRTVSGSAGSELVRQWQAVHDETYRRAAAAADPTFHIVGWNNSYDGFPIPEEEMREWVEGTVLRIASLRPGRVLEIGCGTGLLLFRIAPGCERYAGTDFSPAALSCIQNEIHRRDLPQVELSRREAVDFSGFEPGSFDTIILNSVVQYFPDIEHLMNVLAGAFQVLAPGGKIFLGDLRSLPLLSSFHLSVELARAPSLLAIAELRRRVLARLNAEEELAIDPALFPALRAHFPRLRGVSIQPKRGRFHNELTRFRFDAVLACDHDHSASSAVQWFDWAAEGFTVERLRHQAVHDESVEFGVRGVPNARLGAIVRLDSLLASQACPKTAGELRDGLMVSEGADPEEVWRWRDGVNIGCSLEMPDRFDVSFKRSGAAAMALSVDGPAVPSTQRLSRYANRPVRRLIGREFTSQLRTHVAQRLPRYMEPSTYVFLDRLPLSPNGKVDRNRLPPPEPVRTDAQTSRELPQSPTEVALAAIWAESLGAERIGRTDNFFADLGGHSLAAMRVVSGIRHRFRVDLPLRHIFEFPTLVAAAKCIEEAMADRVEGAASREACAAHRL
jgi:amino acid adenylation domain-containing protein